MNGSFMDSYPEGKMVLPPREMLHCGESPIVSHLRQDNLVGMPIRGTFAEFINIGQTLVYLNESVPILPGGGYRAIKNPCLDAIWTFHAVNSPPAVDSKIVQAGNNLKIIVHKNPGSVAELKQPAANVNLGGVTVSTNPDTEEAGTFVPVDQPTGTINVPADATFVNLKNEGGLDPNNLSTVNGVPYHPGNAPIILEKKPINGIIKTIPAITIETNGNRWVGYYFT